MHRLLGYDRKVYEQLVQGNNGSVGSLVSDCPYHSKGEARKDRMILSIGTTNYL